MRGRWINYFSGILVILATPIMAQSTIVVRDTSMIQSQVIQSQAMLDLGFQDNGTYISPIIGETEVISPFGELRSGYTHQGIDFRLPMGTPIYAVADATVIKAAPDSKGVDVGGGHIIMLDHGEGVQTWYMHLDAYAVALGDKVTKGQIIGFSGNSGESTTPHLHFEYRINSVPIDPSFILKKVPAEKTVITLNEPFIVIQS